MHCDVVKPMNIATMMLVYTAMLQALLYHTIRIAELSFVRQIRVVLTRFALIYRNLIRS